jgi:hypothetical protein
MWEREPEEQYLAQTDQYLAQTDQYLAQPGNGLAHPALGLVGGNGYPVVGQQAGGGYQAGLQAGAGLQGAGDQLEGQHRLLGPDLGQNQSQFGCYPSEQVGSCLHRWNGLVFGSVWVRVTTDQGRAVYSG